MSDLEALNSTISLNEIIEKFGGYSSTKALKRALNNKGVTTIKWGKTNRVSIDDLTLLISDPNHVLSKSLSKTKKVQLKSQGNDLENHFLQRRKERKNINAS